MALYLLSPKAEDDIDDITEFTYKAHAIFYESTNNGIYIVRVLGQRQDFWRHL